MVRDKDFDGTEPASVRVAKILESADIDTVMVALADHNGRLMGKRLTARHFLDHVVGGGVEACDYLLAADIELEPLPGFRSFGWHKGYGDFHLAPDLSTFRVVPWFESSALVLCDVTDEEGRPVEVAPRRILRRQLERAAERGFFVDAATELEFYLFDGSYRDLVEGLLPEPTTDHIIDYDLLGTSADEPVLRRIRNAMNQADVPVEGSKGEWGRGQHEVNLAHGPALLTADRHVVFKQGVKAIAGQEGRAATFMAKPATDMAGSSCHIHVNLRDGNGTNAFCPKEGDGPSDVFNGFVAGLVRHLGDLGLFLAPTVNSYRRYQSKTFAPVNLAWAWDNRTAGLRVVGHGSSLRVECRVAGADANPYLALAAIVAAGLAGIDDGLELPAPVEGNAYEMSGLPTMATSLGASAARLKASSLASDAFGADVVEHYAHLAELEQAEADRQVTDWEVRRYFERI